MKTHPFTEYQKQSENIRERAQRVQDSIHNRGWNLAQSVGIGRCGCSLHNASIDDKLTGWCFKNPERLRVAKLANALVNDWSVSHIADRIISRLYNKLVASQGYARSSIGDRTATEKPNVHILFRSVK